MKIIFYNFADTFSSNIGNHSCGDWYKPFVWATGGDLILLYSGVPPTRAGAKIIDPQIPEKRLLAELLRVTESRETELLYFVYSETVQTLAHKLRAHGRRIGHPLPLVTPGQIRYWNSKIGGRQLLQRQDISAIHALLPTATPVFNRDHLPDLVNNGTTWLLKSNLAAGGAGILRIDPGSMPATQDIDALLAARQVRTKGKKGVFSTNHFLLEECIGDTRTNRSITADFWVGRESTCVGVALAKMAEAFHPAGIQWQPDALASAGEYGNHREAVVRVGLMVSHCLYELGYRGYCNLDFVLTRTEQLALCEINVRRSAPLDQFLVLNATLGDDWRDGFHMDFTEGRYLDRSDPQWQEYLFDGNQGIIWLTEHPAVPVAASPYLLVGRTAAALATLRQVTRL